MSQNKTSAYFLSVGIAIFCVFIDQATKYGMKNFMEARDKINFEVIPGFFSLVFSNNTGVAFGLLKDVPPVYLSLPILVVVLLMAFVMHKGASSFIVAISTGMIIGGALGNLIDRVGKGQVFDFLLFYIGRFSWPAFNAADVFIVAGVFLFSFSIFRGDFDEPSHSNGSS